MEMALAILSCAGFLFPAAELTGLSEIYSPLPMFLVGSILCVAYGVLKRIQKEKWFFTGAFALLLCLVVFLNKSILNGICLFWNRLGDTWTAETGWVLPALEAQENTKAISLLYFSAFAGGLIAVLCCGLSACGMPILVPILPGAILAGAILLCKEISAAGVLYVLSVSVLLLLTSGGKESGHGFYPVLCRLIPAACLCGLLLAICMTPKLRGWVEQVKTDLQKQIHSHRYETEYTTLPEGNFTDFQELDETAVPALIVNMDTPEAVYLRGFTGAIFEDDAWRAMDPGVLAENENLLYWLNVNEFNPNAQFERAAAQTPTAKNTITVQNIGACSRYLYVPYSLCAGIYLQPENLSPDGVQSDGERIYVYTAVTGGREGISQTLEQMQGTDSAAFRSYRRAESAYRTFVYDHYLQIPPEVTEMMQAHWASFADGFTGADASGSTQAQVLALDFLESCFPEDGTQSNMELPLKAAENTSFQHATVAVMTLRYFGIPARYAEGYRITEEMAASAESGAAIELDSSCAGAWVEVYQDGLGWIPMDMLPGLDEEQQTQNDHSNGKNTHKTPEEGKELEEPLEDTVEEPDPNGGYMVMLPKIMLWGGLVILAAIVVLIAALVIRRRMICSRRLKRFHSQDRKTAVAGIFAETARLLSEMGFDRGNGSMFGLCDAIRQRFDEAFAEQYETMVRMNARAIFSSHEMEEAHLEYAIAFHASTLQQLKTNTKWHKKLWMQWILCLY